MNKKKLVSILLSAVAYLSSSASFAFSTSRDQFAEMSGCYKTLEINQQSVNENDPYNLSSIQIGSDPFMHDLRGQRVTTYNFSIFMKSVGSTRHSRLISTPLYYGEYKSVGDKKSYSLNEDFRFKEGQVYQVKKIVEIEKLTEDRISIAARIYFDVSTGLQSFEETYVLRKINGDPRLCP